MGDRQTCVVCEAERAPHVPASHRVAGLIAALSGEFVTLGDVVRDLCAGHREAVAMTIEMLDARRDGPQQDGLSKQSEGGEALSRTE